LRGSGYPVYYLHTLNLSDMPTERKHATAATAEVVLVENPLSPRFEIDLCRPDRVFLLAGTDDERTAETIFLRASLEL